MIDVSISPPDKLALRRTLMHCKDMPETLDQLESGSSIKKKFAMVPLLPSMGVALIVHLILALAIGGYVVFEGVAPTRIFEGDFIDNSGPQSPMDEAPVIIEEVLVPQIQSAAVQMPQMEGGSDAPDMSDLITVSSVSNTPTFSMPTTAGNPALLGSITGAGRGTGQGKGHGNFVGSHFGSRTAVDNALVGHLYDLKQDAAGKSRSINASAYQGIIGRFVQQWDESILKDYYRAQASLYARQFFIPLVGAEEAPRAFEAEKEITPTYWLAHYKGEVVAPFSGRMRFAGQGDNVLIVRFDDKVVLDACLGKALPSLQKIRREPIGKTADPMNRPMVAGEWIRVIRGTRYPMEVLLGEFGGLFSCFLLIQDEEEDYRKQSDGKNPRLPIFQVGPAPLPEYQERINSPEIAAEPFVFSQ